VYRSYDVGLLHLFSSVRRRNRATYDSQRAALYSPNYTARRTPEIEDVILFSGDGVSPLLSVSSKTGFNCRSGPPRESLRFLWRCAKGRQMVRILLQTATDRSNRSAIDPSPIRLASLKNNVFSRTERSQPKLLLLESGRSRTACQWRRKSHYKTRRRTAVLPALRRRRAAPSSPRCRRSSEPDTSLIRATG